ncbi:MAG: TonB-dependent receptor [Rubrivivax sp.]
MKSCVVPKPGRGPVEFLCSLACCLLLACGAIAPAAAQTPAAAEQAASAPQRVEINATRESDTEQRRKATAAKIVIGREEIDKFGDATLGEVLRRLPGVTTPGAPGRGGPPRMRGLGNGFTQLLIDGQPVARGFSMESLTPEQVERIEILRAPTAETGARAIAGTINIITREGFKQRLNDLRLGFGIESGKLSPGINWTHNDSAGPLTYNVSASAFRPRRETTTDIRTTVTDLNTGTLLEDRNSHSVQTDRRYGLNLTSRLQWRLNDQGDLLMLQPSVFHTESDSTSVFDLTQPVRRPSTSLVYDSGNTQGESRFTNARLTGQWRQRIGEVRLEANGGGGTFRSVNDSLRQEFATGVAVPTRTLDDNADTRENSANLTLKASTLLGDNVSLLPGTDHTLVGGLELEHLQRTETRSTLQDKKPLYAGLGDNLSASSLRSAAYAQDEWTLNPNWSAYAGLRWEGIETQGDATAGVRPTNRSSVWTPLLHAVWKPDPKGRDQVRFSLTRSYRSPSLGVLLGRTSINREYPSNVQNIETAPDSVGNPNLKPELATGVDIAIERYLTDGGVLSANLFHRQISNLIRGVTDLRTVSYSPQPRYVRQQRNIGDATTSGIELEAKFRLDHLLPEAPKVEVRSNLAVFDSNVKAVPGPDNRLDQQARATANLGADYRMRGLPLTLGGTVNWVPGSTTRTEVDQFSIVSRKTVWDAYALWTFSPQTAVRVLGSNLVPRDYIATSLADSGFERTSQVGISKNAVNLQVRLELKL